MQNDPLQGWLSHDESVAEFVLLREREGVEREQVVEHLAKIVIDHLTDFAMFMRRGGFERAAKALECKVPTQKKARSGDFGEIVATEYVRARTEFNIPFNRLRYKDDRETSLRGDDIIGFRSGDRLRVLKGEVKSRQKLGKGVLTEARDALASHSGRPNPSTLTYLVTRLEELRKLNEADVLEKIRDVGVGADDITHLMFILSGTNPTNLLKAQVGVVSEGVALDVCGCFLPSHGDLIAAVFDEAALGRVMAEGDVS